MRHCLLIALLFAVLFAAPAGAQVDFVNRCSKPLTLVKAGGTPTVLATLQPGKTFSMPISAMNQRGANLIIPYPDLTAAQCPDCDGWTALGGPPGTVQREGFMWQSPNEKFAAYCNPSLSGRGICVQQKNCCGPNMVQDGTFGTHWEFTPNTPQGDFVNLSTNYGSGPKSPPTLCGSPGADPNDCVVKAANIFFNVPIAWSTKSTCSFTTQGKAVNGLKCLDVSCPDAYQHPTDDKQATCPATDPKRTYKVEYCPPGSALP